MFSSHPRSFTTRASSTLHSTGIHYSLNSPICIQLHHPSSRLLYHSLAVQWEVEYIIQKPRLPHLLTPTTISNTYTHQSYFTSLSFRPPATRLPYITLSGTIQKPSLYTHTHTHTHYTFGNERSNHSKSGIFDDQMLLMPWFRYLMLQDICIWKIYVMWWRRWEWM